MKTVSKSLKTTKKKEVELKPIPRIRVNDTFKVMSEYDINNSLRTKQSLRSQNTWEYLGTKKLFKSVSYLKAIKILAFAVVLLIAIPFTISSHKNLVPSSNPNLTEIELDYLKIRAMIEESDLPNKPLFLAICKKETNFKSYAFKEKNNLFGLMYGGKVLRFNSIEECITYTEKWAKSRYKEDVEDFLDKLGYPKHDGYRGDIRFLLKDFRKEINE